MNQERMDDAVKTFVCETTTPIRVLICKLGSAAVAASFHCIGLYFSSMRQDGIVV